MKKLMMSAVLLAMSAFTQNVIAGNIYPTIGIVQEMAGTISNGMVTIDLSNSSDYRDTVRFGLSNGEIIYTPDAAGSAGEMLGYKHLFGKSVAGYGLFNFDSSEDDGPDLIFGAAYSGGEGKLMYNINGELFSPGGNGKNVTEIKLGAYYTIKNKYAIGRTQLAGEIVLDTDSDTSSIYSALRFAPKKNVHIDIGLYQSVSGGGDSSVGIPIFFRLTFGI